MADTSELYPAGSDRFRALLSFVEGRSSAPFDVMGPHKIDNRMTVTVFQPGAESVSVKRGSKSTPLSAVSEAPGMFAGKVPGKGAYTLEATAPDGTTWQAEDAYRFGPILGELDEHLLGEGSHLRLWNALGAHVTKHEGSDGVHFAVWAPNAHRVSVVGEFNFWDGRRHQMRARGATGVWEIFVPGVSDGALYRYEIMGRDGRIQPLKADPVGFGSEHAPATASIVRDISGYGWKDKKWMDKRADRNNRDAPISIYEVHLGSWRRHWSDGGRPMSYKEAAEDLVDYAVDMGFTHLELLPIHEHPFDGSWGYQPVGLYAPTIRFGPPHEFRDLVDAAHRKGLGLILDWVPGHFPTDPHGLVRFDGTHLYEHADPKEGFHQDWNTLIYNFGRREVFNYLISNALYWLEEYHVDGLRVDAVASMLYRDYSRKEGEWIPNKDGGRENYEAIALLKRMNQIAYGEAPGIMTIAEESTAYPGVSHPVDQGGLGFGFKWNMGWMNDTLRYMQEDPINRKYHHNLITFGIHYAFNENFILPISHDEVVHGKGSMIRKMPGNEWEKFANLRAYYGFMWGHPGKKLLFMGQEFAQGHEWSQAGELDWAAASIGGHAGMRTLVRDLNKAYRENKALHARDCTSDGFQWIDGGDEQQSTVSFLRYGNEGDPPCAVICNFTPVERTGFRIGLPHAGQWDEIVNTDAADYGGGNRGNMGGVKAEEKGWNGHPASAEMVLPPLSTIILRYNKTK